jgi:RimJ/RimL family protein N-acetyltransferase
MMLRPFGPAGDFELAAAWLQRKENYQWLDFGSSRQGVTPTLLRIMVQRETNFMRMYTSHADDTPIGIVALHNVDRKMRTGTLWAVAGDKSFRGRGCAQLAASRLLTLAFRDLGLHTVNTWAVVNNVSLRAIERLGFRFVGRQRQCHFIDAQAYDRLLFDLLASEHRELDYAGRPGFRGRPDAGATAQLQAHPQA